MNRSPSTVVFTIIKTKRLTSTKLFSLFTKTFVGLALLTAFSGANAVEKLSVNGNQIRAGGQAASFAGMSLFWSNNGWGGERYYTANTVRALKNDWRANIVRAAMGVEDPGGYISNPNNNRDKVIRVVDAAIANDMYVIIDWHSHHAENYRNQAIAFFEDMARRYGNTNNVIYEIYNEPLQVSWDNTIKPYAEAVIRAIRAIDPDNLIVVGTPTWSQDVDVASRNPIRGYSNIAYTLHFYAGTHGQFLRDKAQTALNNGVALFATEWGTVNANGDGGVNRGETNAWMSFLQSRNISHANWALNDKAEGASALRPGASPNGPWAANQLTDSGSFVRGIIRNWPTAGGGGGGINVPSGYNRLRLRHSNKCVDVAGVSTANRANIQQWHCLNASQQRFRFESVGGGWYLIRAQHSNRCLNISGRSQANGANVLQWDCSSNYTNEHFRLEDRGDGWFRLKARHSNKCLDVAGRSTAAGGNIHQWGCHGGFNQQFRFN